MSNPAAAVIHKSLSRQDLRCFRDTQLHDVFAKNERRKS